MAQDLNTTALVGRLTSDPELRQTGSGMSVCSLRVAFTSNRKNGDVWEDKSNFINVNVWGRQAESAAQYLSKGKRVAISGRLEWREWKTDSGDTRSTIEIVADRVQFIEPRSEGQQQPAQSAPPPSDDNVPF
jgi:single-strand DNA-binding protein